MAKAYIGLGANLGDRAANISAALALVEERCLGRVAARSSLHETEPMGGPPGQPRYLNGAALLETDLEPEALLAALKAIEAEVGRTERERWGPREIDLDILLYDEESVATPGLEIPHPRLPERAFALRPLCEIAPEAVHPASGMTVRELLDRLETKENERQR